MASIQASLRSQVVRPPDSLAAMMEDFNKAVYSFSTADKYSTYFAECWMPPIAIDIRECRQVRPCWCDAPTAKWSAGCRRIAGRALGRF